MDELLDELASKCPWSSLQRSSSRRTRVEILKELFGGACTSGARVLVQVILQDMRPTLYPNQETHTTTALLQFNGNSVVELTKWEVMKAWDPLMPRVYRARASFDVTAQIVDEFEKKTRVREYPGPKLGTPVEVRSISIYPHLRVLDESAMQIPRSRKGHSCSDALTPYKLSPSVWAETKYDGER